jgi:fucose permease
MPTSRLHFGRYDYAAYCAFTVYAGCALILPVLLVSVARDLDFPLDAGGMASGGALNFAGNMTMTVVLAGCGLVAARLGKRVSMGWSLLFMGGGTLACAFMPRYWMLFPCMLVAGIGHGLCEGLATPFVQDLHPDAPERYVSISHGFWSVGTFLCVVFGGGLLALGVHWRVILAAFGAVTMLNSLWFLGRAAPGTAIDAIGGEASKHFWRNTAAIARDPHFWRCGCAMLIGAGAELGLTFWAPSYIQLQFHTGPWLGGLGTGAIAVGMFAGRTAAGVFATPRRLRWILLGAAAAAIPVTLLLALLRPGLLPQHLLLPACYLLLILAGICVAPFWPVMQIYGVSRMPRHDPTMLYIYFSLMGMPGSACFPLLMGALGDRFGLVGTLAVPPVCSLLYILLVILETRAPSQTNLSK